MLTTTSPSVRTLRVEGLRAHGHSVHFLVLRVQVPRFFARVSPLPWILTPQAACLPALRTLLLSRRAR